MNTLDYRKNKCKEKNISVFIFLRNDTLESIQNPPKMKKSF